MLFVAVGKQITSCYKAGVYHIPLVKRMVDASPADAVFLEPSDDLHEDPFVLPDVLGYLGMPDSTKRSQSPPWDYKAGKDLGCQPHHRAPQQSAGNCSGGSEVIEDRSSSKEDKRSVEVCSFALLKEHP